ncbi:MAG: biopolymer transporter ExbD [bacterium]|nr:biopolymer transporter ExbD [bacterium]
MSIRIDMTPMVDIAFLLLIFFMVTTVFRLPQAMEMLLPETDPDNPPQTTRIFKQKLVTIIVMENDSLAFAIGDAAPRPLPWDSLRTVLLERKDLYGDSVVALTKIHRKARFESMVNAVDELNVVGITRFSIDKYTTWEDSLLRVAGFQTSGSEGLPEPLWGEAAEAE